MKKLFLTGVLAAVMAFSSTAFAAVEQGGALSATYNESDATVSIGATDLASYEGQMTILILNKDTGVIEAQDIIYIDQTAAGENIFQNMGVLLPDGTSTLAPGTYTVKVGGENVPELLVATFTVGGSTGTEVTFVWGDVNASGATDNNDAYAILTKMAGGASKVGNSEYAIGEAIIDSVIWGDVNASGATDNNDAYAVLTKMAGGASKVGNSEYAIGESVTINVPNA